MGLWRVSQLQNGYLGCKMAHVCLGSVSQLRKISQRMVLGLRNSFAEGGLFHNKTSISQRAVLGLRNGFTDGSLFRKGAIFAAKFSQANEFP